MRKYKRVLVYKPVGNLEPLEKSESVITLKDVIKLKGIAKDNKYGCIKYTKDYLFIKYNGYGNYYNYITVI